jgi:hypothetical protein
MGVACASTCSQASTRAWPLARYVDIFYRTAKPTRLEETTGALDTAVRRTGALGIRRT